MLMAVAAEAKTYRKSKLKFKLNFSSNGNSPSDWHYTQYFLLCT